MSPVANVSVTPPPVYVPPPRRVQIAANIDEHEAQQLANLLGGFDNSKTLNGRGVTEIYAALTRAGFVGQSAKANAASPFAENPKFKVGDSIRPIVPGKNIYVCTVLAVLKPCCDGAENHVVVMCHDHQPFQSISGECARLGILGESSCMRA